MFGVSSQKLEALQKRMQGLGIREDDIEEKFIKGSGSGGQKINKTSSCVQLFYAPSNWEVKCQRTRSQALNRYYARILLCEYMEEQIEGKRSKKQQAIEKLKRQKRKRSKRAKEKVLTDKRAVSVKKSRRKPPED